MKFTNLVLAGTAALLIAGTPVSAQQEQTGVVTKINRLDGTMAIRPVQEGTVGANTGGTDQEFKVKEGLSLEDIHVGYRITYSTTDAGGAKTITKFKKQ